jgi:outer membrane protein assembly factor BamB
MFPPPGGGGAPKGKSQAPLIIGIILTLVLAGGAGAWFFLGSDDDGGGAPVSAVDPSTPGGLLWEVNEEAGEHDRPRAFWPVGDTLVKAGGSVFTAYATADGSVAWTLDLESEHVCVPTTASGDGRVVVGHGDSNCSQNITLVDLNTGETGWSRPMEPVTNPLGFEIAMAGESYAIHTNGGWNLHRVDDGELIEGAGASYDALQHRVFDEDTLEPREVTEGEELCGVDGLAGGEVLIRRRSCATVVNATSRSLSAPTFMIEEIDPATGETRWSVEVPDGRRVDKIHSVSPLVVSFRGEEFGPTTELAFISGGQITAQIPIEATGVDPGDVHGVRGELCRGDIVAYSRMDDCGGMAVQDELLYISPTGMGGGNPVTAINVTTGEVAWSYVTEDFFEQTVLAADDTGVIVHQAGYSGHPGQVVRISADGQQVQPLFQTGEAWMAPSFFTVFSEGQLFFSPYDYSLDQDVAAYGPEGETQVSPSAAE